MRKLSFSKVYRHKNNAKDNIETINNNMFIHDKKNKGITLIALVVTIIVLLILAGITIAVTVNGSDLFRRARQSTEKWNEEQKKEEELIKKGFVDQINEYQEGKNEDSIDIDDYVKNGLVLWYDGIQNTRNGNNPNATSWEDLSGNNNDGMFSNAMVANQNDIIASSKGYYDVNEKGYVFWHNDAYIESVNNIGISGDDKYTVEIVMTPYQVGSNSNFPNGYGCSCPLWLGTTAVNNVGTISFGYIYGTKKVGYWFINDEESVDTSYDFMNKIFSVSYRKNKTGMLESGDKDVFDISINNESVSNTYKGRKQTTNLVNGPAHIGREWQYSGNRTMYGVVHAIRIYNRVLTNEEVAQNYFVDNNRYIKNLFTIDKEQKRINIDASNLQKIMYVKGKEKDVNNIKNRGQNINISGNNATLDLTQNGQYSFLITDKSGVESIEIIQAEGMDLDTTYRINNTDLTYKRIVTVGQNEECNTVKEAFDFLYDNGYIDNGAILLKEGTHDTKELHKGSSYNILPKYNGMTVSIIADSPGNTFMTGGEMMLVENNSSQWIKLNCYRIIFSTTVYTNGSGKNRNAFSWRCTYK